MKLSATSKGMFAYVEDTLFGGLNQIHVIHYHWQQIRDLKNKIQYDFTKEIEKIKQKITNII